MRPPPLGTGDAQCFSNETFKHIGLFNGGKNRPRHTNPIFDANITVTNILTDFMLALVPVPLIWTLQMPLRARVSLVFILSLGTFAAIAGIIRQVSSPGFSKPEPWIYDTYTIWNFIELDTGIIAGSLPGVKPLFGWFYNTALSRKPTNPSGYKTPNELGYRKQTHPSDSEGFALEPYGEAQKVQVTTNTNEKTEWDMERAKSSEESILPRNVTGDKKSGIRITREVQVD